MYEARKDTKTFVKSEFYEGGNFAAEATSIVSERSPQAHAEMRRYLASAFSDRSLKAQEPLIAAVVDEFIEQIGIKGKDGLDLVLWFNLTTFDIIGSLAFGQDFGGVKSGTHHFWVSIVVKSLGLGALADCFKRFPWAAKCFLALFPGLLKKLAHDTRRHEAYTMDLVKKRIANPTGRTDFLTKILESRKEANIPDIQLAAHSSDFVIAGSETTATALSSATYYLLHHPAALRRLQDEVRGAFQKYEEISAASTASLSYLKAVVLEAMRMYPPLPFSLPRVVPDGGATVDGYFLPEGTIVSTSPFAACMSSQNFEDPREFRPERWIGKNLIDNLDASQPFSLGTRGCMGRSLGWIELQTIMAKLHFKYDLTLLNDTMDWQKDSRMYTLWEKPSLMVKVIPRE
ncbi:benzoate 4-monooxygenase cytochrome P450 [Penicillium maclennaniae]|uniref:benzoate 4-monooxygenase cytochrome P450 n=1 Tax=Penicillium maclennaniae TaxID=1343394 RepID=UPI002541C282|nr:benzoate 4-monooxygenase cytochrome P450 [Penicillium maclennaniae]KAJ5674729.1 benzoate 4-monooxygenase cytochrome P450 [Penicillium maclennaniae]